MIPVVALVGRPNVGKSTLFNRLTRSRDALVADFSGLTRDRKYGEADLHGRRVLLIDTGGITGEDEGLDAAMANQSIKAAEEADVVLFMLDCKAGLTSVDATLAQQLRTMGKPLLVVANKVDGQNFDMAIAPFFELGMGDVHPVTASQGRGVRQLTEAIVEYLPIEEAAAEESEDANKRGIKIAIVGRPNVGKSTLVNRLLGEDRVVVYDMPGTTRDSVYIDYERDGNPYTLIDTAGVRRRKNIRLAVEKFSIVKTLQAIDDANVVIAVMDAQEGLVEQDLHLMGQVIDSGRALVIAVNKWDGLETEQRDAIKRELERRLRFIDFADVHFISALHGSGVGNLYESIEQAYQAATDQLGTSRLTRILEEAVTVHQPPMVNGRRIKLRYAHSGGHNPPIIVIHGNQTDKVPNHYVRYLEKTFRRALELHGTPVKIRFKTSDNPFEGRKNALTQRQVQKKQRLARHFQKQKNDRKKR